MRSQCRPIIVKQNSANRECPKVPFKSVRGLGETVLQKTFYTLLQLLSEVTLNKDQNNRLFEATEMTRTQIWSGLWLEQSGAAKIIPCSTSYTN